MLVSVSRMDWLTRVLVAFLFAAHFGLQGCDAPSPPPPSDADIATAIRGDLMANIVTMGLSTVWKDGVSVQNGVVTLTGIVPNEAYKDTCGNVAARAYGVNSVINNIKVDRELDAVIKYEQKFGDRPKN